MEEEFNLSEKGQQDVKEFIKILKEDIFVPKDCDAGTALREMIKRIDKLAGDKLI